MSLSQSFNKSSDDVLNIQGIETKRCENENEEYSISAFSRCKNLKNKWSFPGTENNDLALTEREVEDMKSVKGIHKALSEVAGMNGIFALFEKRFENPKTILNEEDLRASIEKIGKMDSILKMKITEEKKAKLSRIQTEKESRDILTSLSCAKMSRSIKINLKEFLNVLNEPEKIQNDSSSFHKLSGLDELVQDEYEEKKEKTSNHKFVERNIQLAKCGRGTLSLTDEEKLRIKNILTDIEDLGETKDLKTKKIHGNEKTFYAMDEQALFILNQIDEKLQVLTKEKEILEKHQNEMNLSEKTESIEKVLEEGEKEKPNKEKLKSKTKSTRLREINELLSSLNAVSKEEISPLSEEEIGNLVQQSLTTLHLFETEKCWQGESQEGANSKLPKEVIVELVSNAKLLMPKFKYRYDES